MAWIMLTLAGLLEIVWASALKLSEGFSKTGYSILTVVGVLASFYFLSQAMKTLPLGTAYAIWTGIGALGSVIVGIFLFHEPVTMLRMIFVFLLLTGLIGLKITAA